jgi:hypothetical protein
LNNKFPVVHPQVIFEVLLEGINRIPCKYRCNLVAVVEVTAIGHSRITCDLDCNTTVRGLSNLKGLAIQLDRFYLTYTHVALVWDTQRCANLQKTCFDSNTNDDGVLDVEYSSLNHFKNAGEHGFGALIGFSLIATLLDVKFKLIEEVINDISCEDSNTVFICKCLSIRHNLNIECQYSRKLLLNVLTLE